MMMMMVMVMIMMMMTITVDSPSWITLIIAPVCLLCVCVCVCACVCVCVCVCVSACVPINSPLRLAACLLRSACLACLSGRCPGGTGSLCASYKSITSVLRQCDISAKTVQQQCDNSIV
jgi:hypothetical protein